MENIFRDADTSKLRPSTTGASNVSPQKGESNIVTLTRRYSDDKGKRHGYDAAYRSEFRRICAAHAHMPHTKLF